MAEKKTIITKQISDSIVGGVWDNDKFNYQPNTWIPEATELMWIAIRRFVMEAKANGKETANPFDPATQQQQFETFKMIALEAHSKGFMQQDFGQIKFNPGPTTRKFAMVDSKGKLVLGKSPKEAPSGEKWTFIKSQFQAPMCLPCIDPQECCTQALVNRCVQIETSKGNTIYCTRDAHLFSFVDKPGMELLVKLIVFQLNRPVLKAAQEAKQKKVEADKAKVNETVDALKAVVEQARLAQFQRPRQTRVTENKEVDTSLPLSSIQEKPPAAPVKAAPASVWQKIGEKGRKQLAESFHETEKKLEAAADAAPVQFADADESTADDDEGLPKEQISVTEISTQ